MDVTTVREWLTPHDRTLRLLTTDTMNSRSARVEFTCEWFQSHLLEFTRGPDDILFISGASGYGKSILSGWIVERLQRVVGRKSFDVDSVIIGMCNDGLLCRRPELTNNDRFRYQERSHPHQHYQTVFASIPRP